MCVLVVGIEVVDVEVGVEVEVEELQRRNQSEKFPGRRNTHHTYTRN